MFQITGRWRAEWMYARCINYCRWRFCFKRLLTGNKALALQGSKTIWTEGNVATYCVIVGMQLKDALECWLRKGTFEVNLETAKNMIRTPCIQHKTVHQQSLVITNIAHTIYTVSQACCGCFCYSCRRSETVWTVATNGPIVHPPGNTRVWRDMVEWYWQRKPKNSDKTFPSITLSTTNPTWTDSAMNSCLRDDRPASNHLSHDRAL
jgi:hypothetical protein